MLKSLLEQYARRAREFSDSVALLGRHNSVGPDVLKLLRRSSVNASCVVMLRSNWSDTCSKRLWTPKRPAWRNDKY